MPLDPRSRQLPRGNQIGAPIGFIHSNLAGRTDRIPMTVAADSHIIPADAVSGAGQGNSLAGAHIWASLLGMGPHGTALPPVHLGKGPPASPHAHHHYADGGTGVSKIIAAGGEIVVPPSTVRRIGMRAHSGGKFTKYDVMKAGHEMIDHMIGIFRKHTIEFLKNAPEPKK
jgi:hypothetical protein